MNTQQTNTSQTTTRPTTYSLAIVSLILSILGMLPILPVIGSIAGIVTGSIARKEIAAHRDWYTGEALAKAGIILGWIGIALAALAVIGFVLFLIPVSSVTSGPALQITVQP